MGIDGLSYHTIPYYYLLSFYVFELMIPSSYIVMDRAVSEPAGLEVPLGIRPI
jgi:hypothetical protein